MIDFIAIQAPVIALLLFFTIFCAVVINVFRPKNKKKFQDLANIPFKDDKKN